VTSSRDCRLTRRAGTVAFYTVDLAGSTRPHPQQHAERGAARVDHDVKRCRFWRRTGACDRQHKRLPPRAAAHRRRTSDYYIMQQHEPDPLRVRDRRDQGSRGPVPPGRPVRSRGQPAKLAAVTAASPAAARGHCSLAQVVRVIPIDDIGSPPAAMQCCPSQNGSRAVPSVRHRGRRHCSALSANDAGYGRSRSRL
jgi:hypothetical protein